MTVDFVSLAVIVLMAAIVPVIAHFVPRKIIPETVFLLFAGAVVGPHALQWVSMDNTISFLSDLGLAFLFLLAGYEIDPKNLGGKRGAHAFGTWAASFAIALVVVLAMGILGSNPTEGLAVAIALTSTALGTLMPILKERKLMGTALGDAILGYGTWGELGPILAMAILLSARSAWKTAIILAALVLLCALIAIFTKAVKRYATRICALIASGSQTTSQTYLRLAVLLLVALLVFSSLFDLDIVLGAFAAGFVLRYLAADGVEELERGLDSMGYGFFIPLFFICSGTKVDLAAIATQPVVFVGFIVLLMVVRFLPVFIDTRLCPATKGMGRSNRISVAFYCTTALPIIVAVTSLATEVQAMSDDIASVLVCAGAVTVLIMPLLALIVQHATDAQPLEAFEEIDEGGRGVQ